MLCKFYIGKIFSPKLMPNAVCHRYFVLCEAGQVPWPELAASMRLMPVADRIRERLHLSGLHRRRISYCHVSPLFLLYFALYILLGEISYSLSFTAELRGIRICTLNWKWLQVGVFILTFAFRRNLITSFRKWHCVLNICLVLTILSSFEYVHKRCLYG